MLSWEVEMREGPRFWKEAPEQSLEDFIDEVPEKVTSFITSALSNLGTGNMKDVMESLSLLELVATKYSSKVHENQPAHEDIVMETLIAQANRVYVKASAEGIPRIAKMAKRIQNKIEGIADNGQKSPQEDASAEKLVDILMPSTR